MAITEIITQYPELGLRVVLAISRQLSSLRGNCALVEVLSSMMELQPTSVRTVISEMKNSLKLLGLFRLCLFGAIDCLPELRYRVYCWFAECVLPVVAPNRGAVEWILHTALVNF